MNNTRPIYLTDVHGLCGRLVIHIDGFGRIVSVIGRIGSGYSRIGSGIGRTASVFGRLTRMVTLWALGSVRDGNE